MTEARIKLNQNGSVVIPAAFRTALGFEPGDVLVMWIEEGELRITTLKRRIERAQARVRTYVKPGTSLVDELIVMRREAAKHE